MNVVLYRPSGKYWAMTERGRAALRRTADRVGIGKSAMHWDGTALVIDVNEITVPLPRRLRGRIVLHPRGVGGEAVALDPQARHHWRPIAPQCPIAVDFERPSLSWRGTAYMDSNFGTVPLERDFSAWNWSRRHDGDRTTVFYDIEHRDRHRSALAFEFDAQGRRVDVAAPAAADLRRGLWGVARRVRAHGKEVRLLRALEDAPFYTRSLVRSRDACGAGITVHESLSLERFASRWVQILLPFRMPRRG
jgi:carotenoid 1,2-hydratase